MKVPSFNQEPCFKGSFVDARINQIRNRSILSKISHLFKTMISRLCKRRLFGSHNTRTSKDGYLCKYTIKICKYNVIATPDNRKLETACITPESLGYTAMHPATVAVIFTGTEDPFENQAYSIICAYAKMGIAVECVNYGGFGRSEGNISEKSIEIDAETMMQYVKNKYPDSKTVVHGYSLGSYAALHVANTFPYVDKVVLDRGFYKMSLVIRDTIAEASCNNVAKLAYKIINRAGILDNSKKLPGLDSSNILITTSDQDAVMNSYHADKLKKKLPDAKILRLSCAHNNSYWIINNQEFAAWIKS